MITGDRELDYWGETIQVPLPNEAIDGVGTAQCSYHTPDDVSMKPETIHFEF